MTREMNDMDRLSDSLHNDLCRRAFLGRGAMGMGAFALSGLFGSDISAAMDHRVPAPGASAKRVIMLFMAGGLSQLELFDEKKLLNERRGQELPPSVRGKELSSQVVERQGALAVVGSVFDYKKYGKCGMNLSELLPNIGAMADEITLIKSFQTDHVLHEAAVTTLFTGTPLLGRPSWGSWLSYAMGTANKDLPEFVVMLSSGERLSPLHPRLLAQRLLSPGSTRASSFVAVLIRSFSCRGPRASTRCPAAVCWTRSRLSTRLKPSGRKIPAFKRVSNRMRWRRVCRPLSPSSQTSQRSRKNSSRATAQHRGSPPSPTTA